CGSNTGMSTASGWMCLACASRQLLETADRDASLVDSIGSFDHRTAPIEGFEVPARLGPFEVIEEIGRGGMGAVYAARHTELGHVVALKVVAGGGFATAEQQMRFVRE